VTWWRRDEAGPSLPEQREPPADPIAALEEMLANARPVPLTDEVRVDRDEFPWLIGLATQGATASAGTERAAAELTELGRKAPKVMLTPDVRVPVKKVRELLAELRAGG
jgi:hypothetical protein